MISKIRDRIFSFSNIILQRKEINNNNQYKYGEFNYNLKSEMYSLRFFKFPDENLNSPLSKNFSEFLKITAVSENMAFLNLTNCENILKKEYDIADNVHLLVQQIDLNSLLNRNYTEINITDTSNGVNFDFYNPYTKEKLNKSLCNEVSTPISIPFKNSSRIKPQIYTNLKIFPALDAYDIKSPSFHSRCYKSTSLESDADVSINYRRNNYYQNTSISCSEGCEYKGLDENIYVICDCHSLVNEDNSNNGILESLFSLPQFNYDIAFCYNETFSDVK